MTVIDYWGYRFSARAWVPGLDPTHTLVYGSADRGESVRADDSVRTLIEEVGDYLGLKGIGEGTWIELSGLREYYLVFSIVYISVFVLCCVVLYVVWRSASDVLI